MLTDTEYPAPTGTPLMTDPGMEVLRTQNPFRVYRDRTGDRYFSTLRLTDVVDLREYRRTELFQLLGAEPEMQTRMPGEAGTHWTLGFVRTGSNFSQRDRLFIDALRPFLIAYESHRALAVKVATLQAMRPCSAAEGLLF